MSSRLIRATFHSGLLIPENAALEIKRSKDPRPVEERLLLWTEVHSQTHFMRSGDRVYHIANLEQLLFVDKIERKKYGPPGDKKQKIVGVSVHFWEVVDDKYV